MKKKVLFIMPEMPGGGAEKVLLDIFRMFDYGRYDVTLLLEFHEGVYINDIPDSVNVISIHKKKSIWRQRLHRFLVLFCMYSFVHRLVCGIYVHYLLSGITYDAIVSFMEGRAVKIHSYIMGKAPRNLSWIHIDFKKKHWSLEFYKDKCEEFRCYSRMDEIICVSNDVRSHFLELYPIDGQKCKVLYNLINVKEITRCAQLGEKRRTDERIQICMVGRLNHQKRYDRAIEVARLLKDSGYNFELFIYGEGELNDEIQRMISDYGLENYVALKGFVKPPYACMASADIFLITSESEGLPLVICEAFCIGLPVVSTRTSGAIELLDESKYGILVEEDVDAIYKGVKHLIDNELLRDYYAKRSKERSILFSPDKTIREIYALL